MKSRLLLIVIVAILVISLLLMILLPSTAKSEIGQIKLTALDSIQAGDAWDVQIELDEAPAGQEIQLTLWHGLSRLDETVILGTGGIARWSMPADTLTFAGISRLVAQAGDKSSQFSLHVLANEPESIQLITTSNNMIAYGENNAMLIGLIADDYGNPVADESSAKLYLDYPQASLGYRYLTTNNGLAWAWIRSKGTTGRLRVSMQSKDAIANMEIMQLPDIAASIDFLLAPTCIENDGRDIVTLSAYVHDEEGINVIDGTIVSFFWRDGEGKALINDGRALLRIPPPMQAGDYPFYATSGNVKSDILSLSVTDARCQS